LKTEQAGFQVHLDKPIDPLQLIDAINTYQDQESGQTLTEIGTLGASAPSQ
jgi:hypothetical protein